MWVNYSDDENSATKRSGHRWASKYSGHRATPLWQPVVVAINSPLYHCTRWWWLSTQQPPPPDSLTFARHTFSCTRNVHLNSERIRIVLISYLVYAAYNYNRE